MKTNHYLKIFILIGLLFSLAGCDEYMDTEKAGTPIPDGCLDVFFPESENQSVFELEPTQDKSITLYIARKIKSGAYSAPITVEENTNDIFTVPATVDFAEGDSIVAINVAFPNAQEGIPYALKLTFNDTKNINQYTDAKTYVETNVTLIKWTALEKPFIYIDGLVSNFYGVGVVPMYVDVEVAELPTVTKYRLKNAYKVATGDWNSDQSDYIAVPDADGIYDGYAYNWPGDYDASKDYYTVIEVSSDGAFMPSSDLGFDWGNGMFSAGSVYDNVSDDMEKYPLGKVTGNDEDGGKIVFGENSLYSSMADYNDGGKYPAGDATIIYFTKDDYIADNLKIEDFNDVTYDTIPGEISEFFSPAFDDIYSAQALQMALDVDAENEESEYKDLYYLPNLYENKYGFAFYYNDVIGVQIPAAQNTGTKFFGQKVYVSQSENIKSSVSVADNGITSYTFGLSFHYEDGTILGDFAEVLYYAKNAPEVEKSVFLGNFVMSGSSLLGGPDAAMDVTIAETSTNNFVITGITYCSGLAAVYDEVSKTMTITPQAQDSIGSYGISFYTYDGASFDKSLEYEYNVLLNQLQLSNNSIAWGYLIDANGEWADGYSDMIFTPSLSEKSASIRSTTFASPSAKGDINYSRNVSNEPNFKVQGKLSSKALKVSLPTPLF